MVNSFWGNGSVQPKQCMFEYDDKMKNCRRNLELFKYMKKKGGSSAFWNFMNIGSNLKKVEKCRISIVEVWKLKGRKHCSGTLIPTIYSTIRDSDKSFWRHICICCNDYHWISYLDISAIPLPPLFLFFQKNGTSQFTSIKNHFHTTFGCKDKVLIFKVKNSIL